MIGVDTFEPVELEMLIQQSVDTVRDSYNAKGFPDYHFLGYDVHSIGISRKQMGELLSSLDDAEEQLRRDIMGVDELYLLAEGVMPSSCLVHNKPALQTWIPTKDGKFLRPGRTFGISCGFFYAWLYQIDKAGITFVNTFDWTDSANAIVSIFKNAQKKEHTTLQRYIKQKIVPKPYNHHVETLMGISGAGIGEKMGKALIERYGTAWATLHQEPEELALTEGIGLVVANRILTAIGRKV